LNQKLSLTPALLRYSDQEPSSSTSSSASPASLIVSPEKRHGSTCYYQEKFNQAMAIIDEFHEKTIELKEVPGFMQVQKVKPKMSQKNTRITRSMVP